ncbi:hypothetical protein LZS99_12330 [Vibrio fluvialis]|uniref:hypothetical protein n=1 Tax=Vibrio fluvialis TaxID=676 RepID=UPI001F383134|nr:hypothetical protein [Vibrio fluvialis]MCE7586358.1 hypothetical protein [Vibrio fluvialis]
MSKPKVENSIYFHTKSLLNGVLPLEYAIRAQRENAPDELRLLQSINSDIYQIWLDAGFIELEISHEKLLDLSWDILQVGVPLYRTHGRVFMDHEFVKKIRKTARFIAKTYKDFFSDNTFAMTKRFRVVDLLNGNDIESLISKVIKSKRYMYSYAKEDDIPIEQFVLGNYREAISLYPGTLYQYGEYEQHGNKYTGAGILLDFNMGIDDVSGAINEFLYQYGKFREEHNRDSVSSELISNFLREQLLSSSKDNEVTRLDSILTGLLGLYCYDNVCENKKRDKGSPERSKPLLTATTKTLDLVESIGNCIISGDAVEKNYKNVKKRIKSSWDENSGL